MSPDYEPVGEEPDGLTRIHQMFDIPDTRPEWLR